MKKINVEIKGINVASFSPSKEDVSFIILFNDGKDKEIIKSMGIEKGEDAALDVIRAIRKVENSLHAEFDGKAVLDNYISIIINDEDKMVDKMTFFFSKVFEKIKIIKNKTDAEGYISLVNEVNSMKVEFI